MLTDYGNMEHMKNANDANVDLRFCSSIDACSFCALGERACSNMINYSEL